MGGSRLQVRMLGPFGLFIEGDVVRLKPQALRLLALLALNANKSVSRSAIMEVIWDGGTPDVTNVDNQIQVHIAVIRNALARGGAQPKNAIKTLGQGRYKLQSPPLETDLHLFAGKLAKAEDMVAKGSIAKASQTLAEALAMWSGPALDGLSDWFAADSGRLEEQRLRALLRRIDFDLWRSRPGSRPSAGGSGTMPYGVPQRLVLCSAPHWAWSVRYRSSGGSDRKNPAS